MKQILYLLTTLLIASPGYSQTAKKYFKNGNAKIDLKDHRGAIDDYNKFIELEPERGKNCIT